MTPVQIIAVTPLTGVGKELDYKVPGPLAAEIQPGSLVRIPLQMRSVLGVVRKLGASGDYPVEKLKYIQAIVQPFPVLTPELIQLGVWMAGYYNAEVENVFESMLPSAVRKGMQIRQLTLLAPDRRPTEDELNVLRKKAPKQAALLDFIYSQPGGNPVPKGKVLSRMKINAASANGLVEKGFIKEILTRDEREAYNDNLAEAEVVNPLGHTLNPEQQVAVDSINTSIDSAQFKVHLLHGVTGSGKTEVYLRCLREVVQKGGGAVFLVPEVALTPQTVGRLRARLEGIGVKSVVWHSSLSDGERYDAWLALASGEAQVVVGARSAIFAPVQHLKLIIVDEEHEPAYKQADTPRYHGRDVAVYRAKLNDAVCILGSATPSLESFYNVQSGKYVMDKMRSRIDDRQLPVVLIADMRREAISQKGAAVFSRMLKEKMYDRQEKGEQTILFINRRGYNTSMLCPDCGAIATCDHCSVSLTFHRAENKLRCHWCGFEQDAPNRCPKCRSDKIKWRGAGTQRIEDIAQKILPKARIVRIDADTMQLKNRFREILGDFRKGKIDILVGTQMIAKGLDFPNVTLVGLLDADISQHMPDFRAAERTFQLLVQVAGRAGRGDRAGEVVVQSYLPHSPPILFARQQDFDGFIEEELNNRREYNYPPFRHLIHHVFKGKSLEKIEFFANQWVSYFEQYSGLSDVELRGPAPAPMEKINDEYRYQLWYFTPTIPRTIARIRELRDAFVMDREVIDTIDVDAVNVC